MHHQLRCERGQDFLHGLQMNRILLVGIHGFLALKQAGVLKRRVQNFDAFGKPMASQSLMHAGFFFGHRGLNEALKAMPRAEIDEITMTGISFPNTLLGTEAQKRAQRPFSRFVNSGLIATLLGAVSSDQLADGRVVSGVGGQHDFAVMAQQLDDARSIIAIRATRAIAGRVTSNVVWTYANTTLPRNLRDVVVTEYGIADLRGANDRDCVIAMLQIADSTFQSKLAAEAMRAGKLPRAFRLDARFAANRPARLDAALSPHRARGLLPVFPFGTDMNEIEQRLIDPLEHLRSAGPWQYAALLAAGIAPGKLSSSEAAALARLQLAHPQTLAERLQGALVLGAIRHKVQKLAPLG